MKSYLITILAMTVGYLHSQSSDTSGLDRSLVKQLINQQFGSLIGAQSTSLIGNSASIDLKEAEVNFTGNIVFENGSILGIEANGGVSDGFLPIFNNNKLNTKLGLDVQYSFLYFNKEHMSKGSNGIQYDNSDYVKFRDSKRKIEYEAELKKIQIEKEHDKKLIQMRTELEKIQSQISSTQQQISLLETKSDSLSKISVDSLKLEIRKMKQELSLKEYQLKNFPSKLAQEFEIDNWKDAEILKAQSEMKIIGYKLGWISIGYGLNSNAFKLFDSTMPFDNQISKNSYASHTMKLQYSFYKKSYDSYQSFFFSVGSAFSIGDNFSSLSKVEINETSNYGLNVNDRFITNKYFAYQGDYTKDMMSVSVYGDLYWFLFDDNLGAVHFYPEHEIAEGLKPSTNLGFGFLMAFKSEEKKTNFVNSEIYINLTDVFDNGNSSERVFSRSNFGLRFAFPINFNTK